MVGPPRHQITRCGQPALARRPLLRPDPVVYAAHMGMPRRIALGQLPVSPDPAVNLTRVQVALADAAAGGASLAVFPEATQARFGTDLQAVAEPLDGPFGTGLAAAARSAGVALVAGVFEPAPDGRVYNTAVGYDETGERVAAYRKIHLFDSLGETESKVVAPGSTPVLAELAGLRVGILTCYDIRFPELARHLVAQGADLLVVPAAWAAGLFKEEHWVTLVRARAIENTVWVAAAGQVPDPESPRTRAPTGIGRSMLVDPMGAVRLDLGSFAGVAVGEVDTALTTKVRDTLPCLEHRREDVFGPFQ
jgi:predicted amidohydrolase